MRIDDYKNFWIALEGNTKFETIGMHGGCHGTVGGIAADPWISPAGKFLKFNSTVLSGGLIMLFNRASILSLPCES